MATAKRLPSGKFRVRVLEYTDADKVKHYRSFTASTKKEAEYLATEFLMNWKQELKKRETMSFTTAMEIYLNSKVNVLAPSTYTGYKCIEKTLKKDFPAFCSKDIHKITQNDVQIVINELAKKVSQKTVRNRHGFISAVLQYHNVNLILRTTFGKKEHKEKEIPNDEEVKAVLELVKGTEYEVPVMLGGFGMLRVGEVCGLDFDHDINFKTGEITIRHNMVRNYDGSHTITTPKTYSGNRTVTVPMFVVKAIKKKGYITDLYPETISAHFSELVKSNFEKNFTFHSLRHYGASIRLYLGIPYEYVKREGGWASVTVLQQIYAHAFPEKSPEFSKMSVNYFDSVFSENESNIQKKMTRKMTHK